MAHDKKAYDEAALPFTDHFRQITPRTSHFFLIPPLLGQFKKYLYFAAYIDRRWITVDTEHGVSG